MSLKNIVDVYGHLLRSRHRYSGEAFADLLLSKCGQAAQNEALFASEHIAGIMKKNGKIYISEQLQIF